MGISAEASNSTNKGKLYNELKQSVRDLNIIIWLVSIQPYHCAETSIQFS